MHKLGHRAFCMRRFAQTAPSQPTLRSIRLPGGAGAWWQRAGFAGHLIGGVRFEPSDSTAVVGWTLSGGPGARGADYTEGPGFWRVRDGNVFTGAVDRIPTIIEPADAVGEMDQQREHPNGATGLHSVTLLSPDLHRTVQALEEAGLQLRRLADPAPFSEALSMAFFKMGGLIVELVAPRERGANVALPGLPATPEDPEAPAAIVGMVVNVPSLERVADAAPGCVGRGRPAAQGKGRLIASLRHEEAGSPPLRVAFMTPPSDVHGKLQLSTRHCTTLFTIYS